jgi:SAM-dependent methyltransferase
MSTNHDAAWADFWSQNGKQGQASGCLPAGWQGIDQVQQQTWHAFAQTLPRAARGLDIATGDGRVMSWMVKARRDLKLLGVDMAPQLPDAPRGTKVRTGVPMEKLPFPDGRFAAVTSQFGFEYGETAATAREVFRVLSPGGKAGLITHRQDGPILAHNLSRRAQILWALEERGLVDLAKKSLRLRASGLAAAPAAISAAPDEGAKLHGQGSAAWEIAEAVRQTLVLGMRDHPANVARLLDSISAKARNELGRIASLEAACARTASADQFSQEIEASGLIQGEIRPLVESGGGLTFADFRGLTKRA